MYIQNIIIKWGMYVRRFSGYLKYIPLYTKSWKYLEPNCPQASETTDIPAFYRLLHPPCLCTTSTSVVLPIISRHLQRNSTHYSHWSQWRLVSIRKSSSFLPPGAAYLLGAGPLLLFQRVPASLPDGNTIMPLPLQHKMGFAFFSSLPFTPSPCWMPPIH